jgi:hypothetical protein
MKARLHNLTSFAVTKKDGRLHVLDVNGYRAYIEAMGEGEEQEMTLGHGEDSYSYRMLKYIHGEAVKKMCKADGYTPAQAKLVILGEFFGWVRLPGGREVPERASLSELTRAEMIALIDWLPQFGAEHDYNILPPERDPSKRDPRVRHADVRTA